MTSDKRATPKELVLTAAQAAVDKKAADVLILDMIQVLVITDYFLICSGATDRQTKTIADEVRTRLRAAGLKPIRVAGEERGDWILLDYGELVVHIFTEETRDYYQLERLWKDAPRLEFEETGESRKA